MGILELYQSRMRKHRNFLIFYSIWLVAIITMLIVFETPQEKIIPVSKQSNTVCELTTYSEKYVESTKCAEKWCCESKPKNSYSNKTCRKDDLDKI